ncbi:Unknown protein sequence [Pseudomonas amygdali pv. lachrymans]|uniref:Uncharacterized protein n=1 Tax=Pseudomonas amygdali pv. lachrymans TaxID=53707 RepID=A0ABR5KTM7_PSEAV|nr:Unknown protein sequence [Pseudomonas amygdali pv. lachrymans]
MLSNHKTQEWNKKNCNNMSCWVSHPLVMHLRLDLSNSKRNCSANQQATNSHIDNRNSSLHDGEGPGYSSDKTYTE